MRAEGERDDRRDDDGGVDVSTAQGRRKRWRPRPDAPALVALLLGLAGLGYRLVLTLLTLPTSNSDEATFGLAAMHIAAGREHPVFLYGQRYMGMAEAYLAAPLIAVAGPSWPALRLPVLVLHAVFVWLLYLLTRRICSPWFAAFMVGLLALGSERVVRDQLTAVGGRPEAKPAVVLMLLIVVGLAERRIHHRRLAVGLFGLLAGLAVWSDWLVLPYLAVAGLLLLRVSGRELVGWAGVLLVGGFLLGAAPLIHDNLVAPPGQGSLSVLREVNAGTGAHPTWPARLAGGLLESVPLAAGLCPGYGCARATIWYGLLYLPLLVGAVVLAVVAYRRAAGRPAGIRVRPLTHLALLAGAGLTLLAYVRSPLAAIEPLGNARYLSVLQISLPAVLWPLWLAAAHARRGTAGVAGRIGGALAAGALAVLTVATLAATVGFLATSGGLREQERQAQRLADEVRRLGLREVYGEYWTCNRLTFNTGEEVVCAVVDGQLTPGFNRYRPYWARVGRAARPGYVLAVDSPADRRLRALLGDRAEDAKVAELGGYRVYHPETAVRPWR
ncbi:ArnT family glycosyltransferase [Micromonospora mirobrigensis]|uniref:4-amino-4-deoxy-L-arabinose transferase n=1 Tax=Micromonospora mirobrigensis TaxID=262898 RepID=A0A1C4Z8A8_9ACTN|nr:hypothetical protein [Micromonospora mirobrigensis]SCF29222.1 hypothetical protein GA0070564_105177 [Micromonospora mirobrigensis]